MIIEDNEPVNMMEQDFDTIEFWRESLPYGEMLSLPRLIVGKPDDYILNMSDEAILFDSVIITREHLDRMSNKEVIEYIQSQSHNIN